MKFKKADIKTLKSWFKECFIYGIFAGIAGAYVFHDRLATAIVYLLMIAAASRDPKYRRLWR